MKSQIFSLIEGFYRIHIFYLILLLAVVVDAKYPIRIDGSDIKYSPRLMGRSSVVYQGAMYVYGGESPADESSRYSNEMHRYAFDTQKDIVSMSLVKQVNTGPNCTFCGAVMIDDHRMMILTHDYANITDPRNSLATTVVHPYIFDFTSLTWNSSISNPSYTAEASNFRMRTRHNTVIHDEVIYTLGGADYYENTTVALNTSWYYDIKSHSYGIINNNGFDYRSIGGCSFNLPNNTIGSIFGKKAEPMEYNSDENMMILDTFSKSWIENRNLTSSEISVYEGATAQISRSKDGTPNFIYFFGGYSTSSVQRSIQSTLMLSTSLYRGGYIGVLNIQNSTWLNVDTIHNEKDNKYVRARSYASSALIQDKYFVVVSGNADQKTSSGGMSDLDIVQLPTLEAGNILKENENHHVEVVYVPSILNDVYQSMPGANGLTPTTLFFILFFIIVLAITFSICIILNIGIAKSRGLKKLARKFTFTQFFWHRRAGESFTTQVIRLIARILFIATFIGFIYYFVNDIINSSVSSTAEYIESENVTFPDIRFCFTGWRSFARAPTFFCRNTNSPFNGEKSAPVGSFGCSRIERLNNNLFVPSFAEQYGNAYCYMYRSNGTLNRAVSTLGFHTEGVFYNSNQRLRVQFYEPNKNPNRVLYFNEQIEGLDAYAMDAWMDSEMISGSTNNTVNQMVYVNLRSTVYVQFKTITTKQIDPDSLWNYVGIFPKYKIKSELIITHSESKRDSDYGLMPEDEIEGMLGITFVSPADYFDTVITEKRDTTIVSVLGVIGGIVSILFFIQTILFGTKPSAPWGFVQNSTFNASDRESKKRNLSKFFLLPESRELPLETPVHSRFTAIFDKHKEHGNDTGRSSALQQQNEETVPMNTINHLKEDEEITENQLHSIGLLTERINKLEARNQVLELVLKTYYIDGGIFRELQNIVDEEETPEVYEVDSSTTTTLKRSAVRRDSLF